MTTVAEKHELLSEAARRMVAMPPGERFELLSAIVEAAGCKASITLTMTTEGINEHIELVRADETLEVERLRARVAELEYLLTGCAEVRRE